MTSTPPSRWAADPTQDDPLLEHRDRSLRFWVITASVLTVLAVVAAVAAWLLARQGAWTPIPIAPGPATP